MGSDDLLRRVHHCLQQSFSDSLILNTYRYQHKDTGLNTTHYSQPSLSDPLLLLEHVCILLPPVSTTLPWKMLYKAIDVSLMAVNVGLSLSNRGSPPTDYTAA